MYLLSVYVHLSGLHYQSADGESMTRESRQNYSYAATPINVISSNRPLSKIVISALLLFPKVSGIALIRGLFFFF